MGKMSVPYHLVFHMFIFLLQMGFLLTRHQENGRAAKVPKKAKAPHTPKQNTAVYVTGLPRDVTVEEVAEVFSRKCGVIAEEIDSGKPRIKLYMDANGDFKGDALIVFFKPPSV